jgi:hypothetical protein
MMSVRAAAFPAGAEWLLRPPAIVTWVLSEA